MSMPADTPTSTERMKSYAEAISEATAQEMVRDPSVFVYGICADDHRAFYKTIAGLREQFGVERVWGTPLSEDALTGFAVGAALAGGRPILLHERFEYVLLAANQLVNVAAKSRYMFGGAVSVPIVLRAVIGRSWGQGAQHSQGLHSLFANIPGLRVVAPSTPYDAKGALITAIRDPNPVVFVEHRMLHFLRGHVPEEPYQTPLGRGRVLRQGKDITLVGISYMAVECLRAAHLLAEVGIEAEVVDPVWLLPLDDATILGSAAKTRNVIAVDTAWTACGLTAEIAARIAEALPGTHVGRIGYAPVPCPTGKSLERLFYPDAAGVARAAYRMLRGADDWEPPRRDAPEVIEFRGPF